MQYVSASNSHFLNTIRTLLIGKSFRAYIVVFDTATNRGNSYLDIRGRFFHRHSIRTLHVLALPLKDFHAEEFFLENVENILCGIIGDE